MMKPTTLAVACAALLVAMTTGARAQQDDFPVRPITLVIPFPPAGVADLVARPAAQAMQKVLKQPIVVTNRPGAGGAPGNASVVNAKPDGYTVLFTLASLSAIPEAEKISGKTPSYRLDQLTPIGMLSADPPVLVVQGDAPWKTLADLVADAKRRPGALSYSSSGIYGNIHVGVEMFGHASDTRFLHVPFSGGGPANNALLAGQVQFTLSGMNNGGAFMRAGKMRPLAVWGAKRLAELPDVPTLKELGYDVEYYTWTAAFVPAATPAPIVQKLRQALRETASDPDFRAAMEKMQTPVTYLDGPEFQPFWDADAKRLAATIRRIGRLEETK